MAGTKTRFGYFGSGGDEPPGTGESGAARTIIGRDIHLPPTAPEIPAAATAPAPSLPLRDAVSRPAVGAVAAPMTEAITAAIPDRWPPRPRPSRLARLLGRWTTGGNFRSHEAADASPLTDDDLKLPRETAARNVLLVLAIAALTFLITFAIMRWHAPHTAAPLPEAPARMAARPLLPTVATSPAAPPPASVPLPPTAPTPEPKAPAPLAPTVRALRPHKSLRAPSAAAATMPPAHLQDELLPLNP
jgi:hypothetical protein